MACRFTWLSGLLFDEYRKRQTAEGFTWGTKVPRLSTVVLHHRPQQQQQQHNAQHRSDESLHRTDQAANGQCGWGRGEGSPFTTTRCLRKGSVPAVEQRRFFLRGQVQPGTLCPTCGKGHPAKEYLAFQMTSPRPFLTDCGSGNKDVPCTVLPFMVISCIHTFASVPSAPKISFHGILSVRRCEEIALRQISFRYKI